MRTILIQPITPCFRESNTLFWPLQAHTLVYTYIYTWLKIFTKKCLVSYWSWRYYSTAVIKKREEKEEEERKRKEKEGKKEGRQAGRQERKQTGKDTLQFLYDINLKSTASWNLENKKNSCFLNQQKGTFIPI